MIFFERFEQASKRIVNQLWQNDYLSSPARDEAIGLLSPPLEFRIWIERLLLVLGALFVTASVMLFFAFNWAHIPPFVKMGGILALIGLLALVNWLLIGREKKFAADLVLMVAGFMVGVFMAVFGQIYQTGADSYTLFLTWAILIFPWVVMARFAALWVMWLVVCNLAMGFWWDLGFLDAMFRGEHVMILLSLFHLTVYIAMLAAVKMGENWLDKKWIKLLLAIGIFLPVTGYVFGVLLDMRGSDFDAGFWVSVVIFGCVYLYEKFISKSLPEYSVGFFCLTLIVIFGVARSMLEFVSDEFGGFLLSGVLVIGLFYGAYKYYQHATRDFEGDIL